MVSLSVYSVGKGARVATRTGGQNRARTVPTWKAHGRRFCPPYGADLLSCGRCHRDRRRRLLVLELQPIERGVAAALAQQLVVAAGFHDRSVLDHADAVGMRDG